MTLFWSSRSPFARKVMLAAHERGLADRIALVPAVVSVLQPDLALAQLNPLGQVPTLLLGDGRVINDSLVICDYLESLGNAPALIPPVQPARTEALSRHALGNGMIDALVLAYGERRRLVDPLQPSYVQARLATFRRVADRFEATIGARSGHGVDIGDLTLACALAYADFRFEAEEWRSGRPNLARWFADFSQRPAMLATAFVAA